MFGSSPRVGHLKMGCCDSVNQSLRPWWPIREFGPLRVAAASLEGAIRTESWRG